METNTNESKLNRHGRRAEAAYERKGPQRVIKQEVEERTRVKNKLIQDGIKKRQGETHKRALARKAEKLKQKNAKTTK